MIKIGFKWIEIDLAEGNDVAHKSLISKEERNLSVTSGLIATGGKGVIELVWDKCPGEDIRGYHIYRSQTLGGPFTLIASEPYSVTRFMDIKVQPGKSYYYLIKTEDTYGNLIPYSFEVTAKSLNKGPGKLRSLGEIKGLSVKIDGERIVLTWDESMDELVKGYNVYRRIDETDTEFELITTDGPLRWPIYEDKEVEKDKAYLYSIVAVDKMGNESLFPKEIRVLYKSLLILTASFNERDKPFRGGEELVAIIKGSSNKKAYFNIDSVADHISMEEIDNTGIYKGKYIIPYNIENLEASVICFLEDSKGRVTFMVVLFPLKIDNLPSIPPKELKAVMDSEEGVITLKWTLPDGCGDEIDSYRIYREGMRIASDLPKFTHEYRDVSIIPGERYHYTVTSVDKAGNESEPSNEVEVFVPPDVTPPYITGLQIINEKGVWRCGETISVLMIGEPGCEAYFSVGDKLKDIPMIQIHPEGRYEGIYDFKYRDKGKEMILSGRLIDSSGNSITYKSLYKITVIGP